MGLYNVLFGVNASADDYLQLLGLTQADFYRFRDCYRSGEREIAVYTRGGGNNRLCGPLYYGNEGDCREGFDADDFHAADCVVAIQEKLRQHPLYLRDEDDDFDNTYATFYFGVPEDADLGGDVEHDRNTVWLEFLGALKEAGNKNA